MLHWLVAALVAFVPQDKQEHKQFCCPGTYYTSETCACSPKGGCADCKCGGCTGGDKCPCVEFLKKGTGVLAGVVAHKSVAKFQTVVYIEEMPGREFAAPAKSIHVDQKNKEFGPKVLPVYLGTTVEFENSDAFEHNVNSPDNEKFNLGNWGQGEKRTYKFAHAGVYTLLCALHPEMTGYVVALKTPYFTVANEKGEFRIANVPPGTYKVKIWNERLKAKQLEASFEVTVSEGKEAKLEIKP